MLEISTLSSKESKKIIILKIYSSIKTMNCFLTRSAHITVWKSIPSEFSQRLLKFTQKDNSYVFFAISSYCTKLSLFFPYPWKRFWRKIRLFLKTLQCYKHSFWIFHWKSTDQDFDLPFHKNVWFALQILPVILSKSKCAFDKY